MFFRKKEGAKKVPGYAAASIIISTVALALAAGVARWSWLLLDEQLKMRRDLQALDNRANQIEIQYDFWGEQLQKERMEIQKMRGQ